MQAKQLDYFCALITSSRFLLFSLSLLHMLRCPCLRCLWWPLSLCCGDVFGEKYSMPRLHFHLGGHFLWSGERIVCYSFIPVLTARISTLSLLILNVVLMFSPRARLNSQITNVFVFFVCAFMNFTFWLYSSCDRDRRFAWTSGTKQSVSLTLLSGYYLHVASGLSFSLNFLCCHIFLSSSN